MSIEVKKIGDKYRIVNAMGRIAREKNGGQLGKARDGGGKHTKKEADDLKKLLDERAANKVR